MLIVLPRPAASRLRTPVNSTLGPAVGIARALVAFLLLPGLVAYLAPQLIASILHRPFAVAPTGITLLAAGTIALLWCAWAFYSSGRGTLAPWSPPTSLVTHGLYRYSRNPMYCAVIVVLLGWASVYRSLELLLYALGVSIAFHLRVLFAEEPWLERTHGPSWHHYRTAVNRWVGRSPTNGGEA